MLAKLLKNEIRSTSGVMGMLCLAALGVGLMGGLTMRYIFHVENTGGEGTLYAIASLFLMISLLALFALTLGSGIYLMYQFYRRKFTDEGYLTFTLPASAWQIFLASLLNIVFWSLVSSLMLMLAFCLIFFIGLADSDFFREMKYAFSEMKAVLGPEFHAAMPRGSVPLILLSVITGYLSQNVAVMTCITLGSILARRRKLLGAIVAYWCYSMLSGAITGQILTPYLVEGLRNLNIYYGTMLIYGILVSVGGFVLSTWLMKKKLNLP